MRIPLDYYRILGLPIQATAEQLQQAHRDRTQQLPRREYSDIAIESRRQLLDEAYGVLSDPAQRQGYDAGFLNQAYAAVPAGSGGTTGDAVSPAAAEAALRALATEDSSSDGYTPTIEIHDRQIAGALLILQELGEYELVIRLGRPYLSSGSINLGDGQFGDPQAVLADIVLTVSLACLELGREQWQQRQYESAAESLETGRELLLRENLFAPIRSEIQADLYKLRPYRVLELVALPLEQTQSRRDGIKLLRGMLQDRGGIDGTEDDLSGLSIDDFLRFIQQLRSYLTAAEQQELFEAEARRPSGVATYLAVYALLARGFARHQPALVRRAKQMLMRLASRQDVHLEQAVCALLLGQTEEASHALELSQEYEPLAFIREHSQGSPDLLPGLCLYAERWLQQEVFPHFRDLAQRPATLKDYFAEGQVQAYLEAMPTETPTSSEGGDSLGFPGDAAAAEDRFGAIAPPSPPDTSPPAAKPPFPEMPAAAWPPRQRSAATAAPPRVPVAPATTEPTMAERVAQLSPSGHLQPRDRSGTSQPRASHGRRSVPPSNISKIPLYTRSRRSPNWGRMALVLGVGLLGIAGLGFVTTRAISWAAELFRGGQGRGTSLAISLDAPAIEIPVPAATGGAPGDLQTTAETTIQSWLSAKSAALGEDHQVEALDAVLAEPLLTQWRRRAEDAQRDNWFWEYMHELEVIDVSPADNGGSPDRLTATAQVREVANLFELGRLNPGASYDETLEIQYTLIRQGQTWQIQQIETES